ncbi:hypothetical protein CUMW_171880 [Citrus unshiu]|uniref:Transmembrane protein n=1 Tax=Citrus unshiu TaxID=55188 RepID=A0A2H5PVN1_CITUN|nr:hypothetical protein CUMW_171880 [Citrus unshiu]
MKPHQTFIFAVVSTKAVDSFSHGLKEMAGKISSSVLLKLFIFAMVFSSILPFEAAQPPGPPLYKMPPRAPIRPSPPIRFCPQCVCCAPAPPGKCCPCRC